VHTSDNGFEQHLPEAAVMVAFAMHLYERGAVRVEIHPDGEHIKRFDLLECLRHRGFTQVSSAGSTKCGGCYARGAHMLLVSLVPGKGDVVAECEGRSVIAECKGGIINTKHPGPTSKLRRGLCEAVGLLLSRELAEGERHVAVVPLSPFTQKLAGRMLRRARAAGIEIALIAADGEVLFVEGAHS
jgi:hypothetical protein